MSGKLHALDKISLFHFLTRAKLFEWSSIRYRAKLYVLTGLFCLGIFFHDMNNGVHDRFLVFKSSLVLKQLLTLTSFTKNFQRTSLHNEFLRHHAAWTRGKSSSPNASWEISYTMTWKMTGSSYIDHPLKEEWTILRSVKENDLEVPISLSGKLSISTEFTILKTFAIYFIRRKCYPPSLFDHEALWQGSPV